MNLLTPGDSWVDPSRVAAPLPPSSRVIPTHPRPFLTRLSAAYKCQVRSGEPRGLFQADNNKGRVDP